MRASIVARALRAFILAATGLLSVSSAIADNWPAKPLRLILSQPPGSPPDITARLITDRLARTWGQQVVVENRPGGNNVIGAQAAARAAPDGYTFYLATTASVVTNIYTVKNLPYDPVKDFVPVAMMGESPFLIAANPELGVKTLPELIALAKSKPDKLSFSSDGQRGFGGMLGEMLNRSAGIHVLHVPYTGSSPAIQDTVAGRTQYTVMGIPSVIPFVRDGRLRPIAVTSETRLPGLETYPTVAETLAGFAYVGWFALVAPTGTPDAVIRKTNHDVAAVMADEEVMKKLRDLGIYYDRIGPPEAAAKFIAAERDRWSKVTRDIGMEPE